MSENESAVTPFTVNSLDNPICPWCGETVDDHNPSTGRDGEECPWCNEYDVPGRYDSMPKCESCGKQFRISREVTIAYMFTTERHIPKPRKLRVKKDVKEPK